MLAVCVTAVPRAGTYPVWYSLAFSPTHVLARRDEKPMSSRAGPGLPGSSMSISWLTMAALPPPGVYVSS